MRGLTLKNRSASGWVGDAVVTAEEKGLAAFWSMWAGKPPALAVYAEGSVRFTKELPIGSDAISHDLSHALRTSLPLQAQKQKEKHGAASRPGGGATLTKTSNTRASTVAPRGAISSGPPL